MALWARRSPAEAPQPTHIVRVAPAFLCPDLSPARAGPAQP